MGGIDWERRAAGVEAMEAPSRIYCCLQPCSPSSTLLKKGLLPHLSHHWSCQGLEDSGEVSSSDCSAQPGLPAEASVSSWGSPRLHVLQPMVSCLWDLGWCLSKQARTWSLGGEFQIDSVEAPGWLLSSAQRCVLRRRLAGAAAVCPGELCLAVMLRFVCNGK